MIAAESAVELLFKEKLTIAVAESCTGGLIASELVDFAGISELFSEGYITYSNESKEKNLGVRPEILRDFGAVSEECSRAMAEGVRARAGADIGLSSTGIAGPDGGSEEKPVGLVYVSCSYNGKVITRRFLLKGSRQKIRLSAAREAFLLLKDTIETFGPDPTL